MMNLWTMGRIKLSLISIRHHLPIFLTFRHDLKWWKDQVAMCTGEGLAGHAELLSTMDARDYLGGIKIPTLILVPTKSSLANLDGENLQRELHEKVAGSKLEVVDGAGHEIYVDRAEECQEVYLNLLAGLEKMAQA